MNTVSIVILAVALCAPCAWFASEFQERRWLRLALGSLAILMCVGVAVVVGSAERLNSNSWFGNASKSLVDAIVGEIEAGRQDRVIQSLKRLQTKYHPTYENRARYDELVEETIRDMGLSPETPP